MSINKRIKAFTMDGEIADDSFISGHREKMERMMDAHMRNSGYVPHLDLDTHYFLQYNEEKDTYYFELVYYGVYVGKRKAFLIVGLTGSTYIYK